MDFYVWFKEQTLLAKMWAVKMLMKIIMEQMQHLAERSEAFTRTTTKDAGVTQMYRAGEGETDLRYEWKRLADYMVTMDVYIDQIEKRARP